MSFVATLDSLFNEIELIHTLNEYYFYYLDIKDQYLNLETLETIRLNFTPKELVKKYHNGSINENIFLVIDPQTKEVLFQAELDNPVLVDYVEGKYLLKCNNKYLIYDEEFKCVEIKSTPGENRSHLEDNKDKIFMFNECMGTYPNHPLDIYTWEGIKVMSIICNYYCCSKIKLIIPDLNKKTLCVYETKDLQLLKTFDIIWNCDKYVIGRTVDNYYILDLILLSLNLLPDTDVVLDLHGIWHKYYIPLYVQDDILCLFLNNTTLGFYSLLQNIMVKTVTVDLVKLEIVPIIKHFTTKYLIYINAKSLGDSRTFSLNILDLETTEILEPDEIRHQLLKLVRNGILFT